MIGACYLASFSAAKRVLARAAVVTDRKFTSLGSSPTIASEASEANQASCCVPASPLVCRFGFVGVGLSVQSLLVYICRFAGQNRHIFAIPWLFVGADNRGQEGEVKLQHTRKIMGMRGGLQS